MNKVNSSCSNKTLCEYIVLKLWKSTGTLWKAVRLSKKYMTCSIKKWQLWKNYANLFSENFQVRLWKEFLNLIKAISENPITSIISNRENLKAFSLKPRTREECSSSLLICNIALQTLAVLPINKWTDKEIDINK